MDLRFLELGTSRSGQLTAPAALPPAKKPPLPVA
jgi:hypothetical protein